MRTFEPIPDERVPRLVTYLCVAVGTALIAGRAARRPDRRRAAKPSP